jgi:hypothetical protein
MTKRFTGKKITIETCVTPETYIEIENKRGLLKRSTYVAMVLEELFNPQNVMKKPDETEA